jgi:hypothetical protein
MSIGSIATGARTSDCGPDSSLMGRLKRRMRQATGALWRVHLGVPPQRGADHSIQERAAPRRKNFISVSIDKMMAFL